MLVCVSSRHLLWARCSPPRRDLASWVIGGRAGVRAAPRESFVGPVWRRWAAEARWITYIGTRAATMSCASYVVSLGLEAWAVSIGKTVTTIA